MSALLARRIGLRLVQTVAVMLVHPANAPGRVR